MILVIFKKEVGDYFRDNKDDIKIDSGKDSGRQKIKTKFKEYFSKYFNKNIEDDRLNDFIDKVKKDEKEKYLYQKHR